MTVLTAVYDLAAGPVSFDFAGWLVRAMIERDRSGCSALHVCALPTQSGGARAWGGYDEEDTRWRLWHIVAGLCPLAGATITIAPERTVPVARGTNRVWHEAGKAHLVAPIVAHARAGGAVPRLRATPVARRFIEAWLADERRPVVTLTMRRHTSGVVMRNTDAAAWGDMATWLRARGCRVIELEDTVQALSCGRGHAELDVDLRLALYERAAMNLIGRNGPITMLWFSQAPYLAFDSAAGADDDLLAVHGIARGEQWPWALAGQREAWRRDTFAEMRDEFERWAGATS